MKSLQAFLEHVSLVMDNDEARQGERVTIMTIHAAKGLEFDIVYLPGWEEGVFPSQRALDEGGLASLEEERRLAYVAITRARRRATIIHAANRRIYGQWTSSIPSRFLAELPKAQIEEETTMTGGESLWRAQWSERADPFAHVGPAAVDARLDPRPWLAARQRGGSFNPRAAARSSKRAPPPSASATRAATISSLGQRVFHGKFGYGTIAAIEGNKLEIDFEHAGRKKVLDSFVSARAECDAPVTASFRYDRLRIHGMIEVQLSSSNSGCRQVVPPPDHFAGRDVQPFDEHRHIGADGWQLVAFDLKPAARKYCAASPARNSRRI